MRVRADKIEQEIRSERLLIYKSILEPFILMFTKDTQSHGKRSSRTKSNAEQATELIMSVDYRQSAFKLMLFVNDDVARVQKHDAICIRT